MNFDLTWKQALQPLLEWSYLMSQSQHSPVIPSLSQPPYAGLQETPRSQLEMLDVFGLEIKYSYAR